MAIESVAAPGVRRICKKKSRSKPLGPADGPVKTAIFGGNNAWLFEFKAQQRAALENDKLAGVQQL